MELTMATYIVRIYRRTKDKPEEIIGLVEHVDTQDQFRFHNLQELCAIIAGPAIEGEQRTGKTKKRRN